MLTKDKRKHFWAGLTISVLVGLFLCPKVGLVIACTVGAGKEILWDFLLRKGTPEWLDFVFTCLGGVVGYALLKLL